MSTMLSRIQSFAVKAAIVRRLSLHEHVAMKLLNQHKIKTPRFGIAATPSEADKVARDLLTKNLVVKAQVLADGRDTGHFTNCFRGGIHTAISPGDVKEISQKMLGQRLITADTDLTGKICNTVLVSERKFPRRKFYFAITLAPEHHGPVVTASYLRNGQLSPENLFRQPIDPCKGLDRVMANWIARKVGICDQPAETEKMLMNLYQFFMCKELVHAELSPWIEDVCLNYYATDVKLEFDDNAKFRQEAIHKNYDPSQDDEMFVAARKLGMNLTKLDGGSIACIVNDSGLTLATNDILKIHGGKPASLIDITSRATSESVKKAVALVMRDEKVTTIFVNICGGLLKCDEIVDGLIKVSNENERKVPIVVSFKGLKDIAAMDLIKKKSTSHLIIRKDLDQAAKMAVRCAKIMKLAAAGDLDAILKMKMLCECDPAPPKMSPPPSPCPPATTEKPKMSTKSAKM